MATVTALRKPKEKVTVGGLIDQMSAIREERRLIAAQDKDLVSEYTRLESQLIDLMDAEGCTKSTGRTASAGIGETTAFSFDTTIDEAGNDGFFRFMAFVAKKKYFHLVQRRVSSAAVEEIFAKQGTVPGVTPFTKRSIRLTNLKPAI